MAKVWVKALSVLNTEDEHGKPKKLYPGDWAEVGKQQARTWLGNKQCEILDLRLKSNIFGLDNCGIKLFGGDANDALRGITVRYGATIDTELGEDLMLTYPKTLIWDTGAKLKPELIAIGFNRLSAGWQIAVPLLDYDTLAQDLGGQAERDETKTLTHDLRIPVYDSRVLFVRRCPETKKLLEIWQNEAGNRDLAFLRALYQVKPFINALPVSWTD